MKVTAIALIIAVAIIGILAILGILSTNEYRDRITELEEINTALEVENFVGGAAIIKVKEQADEIKEQADLIVELRVKEVVLEYTLVWVWYVDELLKDNNIFYFEYIGGQVLEEGYFEDLEEQVEWFDHVENGE